MDNRIKKIEPLPLSKLASLGLRWYEGGEEWDYLTSEIIAVTQDECGAFYDAAEELYEMYDKAVQHVIDNGLWKEIGIPKKARELIRFTWEDERHIHLYSRFDFAGGLDNLPIKLIEFNADTATVLPETAIIQWEQLKANGMDADNQFNDLYEDLVESFRTLREKNEDLEPRMMVSTLGHPEDKLNADLILDAAKEAGFEVTQVDLQHVVFSEEDGIFEELGPNDYLKYDFWFKLVPWEFIAYEEPELMELLTEIVTKRLAVVVNPAYSMVYQSKALMKVLWDLYPDHPLLLKTKYKKSKFEGEPYVKKVIFGREGENITIVDKFGKKMEKRKGDFGDFPSIFQKFSLLPRDTRGNYYQPGVFYATEPSALSFRRRDSLIVDEDAEFIGHYIK